jgi:hypothetical protein
MREVTNMTAAVWTLIGLLAVSQGVLATALFQLRGEMREGFAQQTSRIDALVGCIDTLAARIDAHVDRHAG